MAGARKKPTRRKPLEGVMVYFQGPKVGKTRFFKVEKAPNYGNVQKTLDAIGKETGAAFTIAPSNMGEMYEDKDNSQLTELNNSGTMATIGSLQDSSKNISSLVKALLKRKHGLELTEEEFYNWTRNTNVMRKIHPDALRWLLDNISHILVEKQDLPEGILDSEKLAEYEVYSMPRINLLDLAREKIIRLLEAEREAA